eukprot:jgi/Botrbrau1/6890/Bobra.67_3s0009.1
MTRRQLLPSASPLTAAQGPYVDPQQGLYTPGPFSSSVGGISSLSEMPFLVFAPFLAAAGVPGQAAYVPGLHESPESEEPDAAVLHKAKFNGELVRAGLSLAWLEAFEELRRRQLVPRPESRTSSLYEIIPSYAAAGPTAESDPESAPSDPRIATPPSDGPLADFYRQILQDIARRPVWQLQSGRWAELGDGCFLQADLAHIGTAAIDYIQRTLPLFAVPWRVKSALEVLGQVPGCTEVTPSSVRPLVKKAVFEGHPLSVQEAAELAQFCFSDAFTRRAADTTAGAPVDRSAVPQAPPAERSLEDTLTGLLEVAGLVPRDESIRTLLQRANLPSMQDIRRDPTVLLEHFRTQQQPALHPPLYEYDLRIVRQCKDLPVPSADGNIRRLGKTMLLVWPSEWVHPPSQAFGSRLQAEFMHPAVVAKLGHHLLDPSIGRELQLKPWTPSVAKEHLQLLIPVSWGIDRWSPGRPGGAIVWLDGRQGGFAPDWLQGLWEVLLQVIDVEEGPPGEGLGSLEVLGAVPLIPLADGRLLRLALWEYVIVPPIPVIPPEAQAQPIQEAPRTGAGTPRPPAPQTPEQILEGYESQGSYTVEEPQDQAEGDPEPGETTHLLARHDSDATDQAHAGPSGDRPWRLGPPGGDGNEQFPAHSSPRSGPALQIHGDSGARTSEEGERETGVRAQEDPQAGTEAASPSPGRGSAGTQPGEAGEAEMPQPWPWLLPLLARVKLPILDPRFPVCRRLVGPERRRGEPVQDTILGALEKIFNVPEPSLPCEFGELDTADRKQLLSFFASHLPSADRPELSACLGRLPIFQTLANTHVALHVASGPEPYGVCPAAALSKLFPSPTLHSSEILERLLIEEESLRALYERLEIPVLNPDTLLARVFLPVFLSQNAEAQNSILGYVATHWRQLKSNDDVVQTLKSIPFIPTVTGEKKQARQLMDPRHSIMARVFKDEDVFPVGQFAQEPWLTILPELGLRTELDANTFLRCAERVASLGRRLDQATPKERTEVLDLAAGLARHLAADFGPVHDRAFLRSLASVAFVPATKGLTGGPATQTLLVRYSDAAIAKDWALAWSVLPILEADCAPPSLAWPALGLRSPPLLDTVVQHLKSLAGTDSGEGLLASWPSQGSDPNEACVQALQHLHKEGPSTDQRRALAEAAFIPVANMTRLLPPARLFARLREDLAPFAYEVPLTFAPHLPLLRELGVRDEPAPSDLLPLLEGIGQVVGGATLNANELRAVIRLLAGVAAAEPALLRKAGEDRHPGPLVPTSSCCLARSRSCVSIGTFSSRFVHRVDPRKVIFSHPDLPQSVIRALGMHALKDVVTETLDPSHRLAPVDVVQGLTKENIAHRLQNPELVEAVHNVVVQYAASVTALQDITRADISRALGAAASALRLVLECHTRVILKAGGRDVTRTDVASKVLTFWDAGNGALYIAVPPDSIQLTTLLSRALSEALGSPLALPLEPLLGVPPEGLPSVCQGLGLGPAAMGGGSWSAQAGAGAGKVGAQLLPHDARLAMLRPLRPFAAGEICAYAKKFGPNAAGGLAAHHTDPGGTGSVQLR